ncbi:restriction endonuclease subunit S [Vibrio cholerae]|nr:restriction endonuclease subunit S [Vibrio cholerae]EJL6916899.1 restriction endonuclease subunit S [Vibrio cholerae]EKF9127838.1 restriction endonuclease subunit S [Vibrio cholerae]EKF9224195.1 restriction endonuclease subunit S [Vibrio cholerae]
MLTTSVPKGWEIMSIGDFTLEHKQGYYTKQQYENEGVLLARITDLGNPKVNFCSMPKLQVSEKDYQAFKVSKGDFLFARSGAIGRYGIISHEPPKTIFASYLIRFRFSEQVNSYYVGQVYESELTQAQIKAISQGNANININAENIKKLKILVPPIREQQKIAEILSTVDKKIDLIDQKIAETEKLKTGLMQKLFSEGVGVQDENGEWHAHTEFHSIKNVTLPVGWKLDNLGTLLEKIVGGGTPSKAKPEYWGGSIPWASVKDFKKPWLSSDCIMDTITNEGLKNSSANLIEPDVVVIPTRMALGKVAMTKGSIAINQDLKALYPKNIIDNLFLFYWLQHQASKIESLGSGSTVAGIRLEILKSIDCLYPESISEQKQISRILKCTDSKIDLLIEQKVATQKLKKGLMQKLLTGEWRVPVEETEAA